MFLSIFLRSNEVSGGKSVSQSGLKQLILSYKSNGDGYVEDNFRFKPGFTYAQVRAISARINQNYDAWPSEELRKSTHKWIGKPVFVNHANEDPTKARGKVIASRYVEAGDDKYIETIMEVDAQRFPKLAKEIREGGLDSVSMGVEAGLTICSHCGNKAVDEPEFCDHVKYHKGEMLHNPRTGKVGPVYELCKKLSWFELSFVFDPADETAVVSRVIAANRRQADCAAGDPNCVSAVGVGPDGEENKDLKPSVDNTDYGAMAAEMKKNRPPPYQGLGDSAGGGSGSASGGGVGGSAGGGVGANGIMDISQPLYDELKALAPDATIGGYRVDDYHEHDSGALDFMTTDADLAQQAIQKGFDAGAPHAIWQQQMWYPDGRTEPMETRAGGDPTQNHYDHVHIGPLSSTAALRVAEKKQPKDWKEWYEMYGQYQTDEPIPLSDMERREMARVGPGQHQSSRRHGYGEIEAPEDVDTLRANDGDTYEDYEFIEPVEEEESVDEILRQALGDDVEDDDPFQHYLESPKELQTPDLSQTQRLDREQESEGLDTDRRAEDVENISGNEADELAKMLGRQAMASTSNRRQANGVEEAVEGLVDAVDDLADAVGVEGGEESEEFFEDEGFPEEEGGFLEEEFEDEGFPEEEFEEEGDEFPEELGLGEGPLIGGGPPLPPEEDGGELKSLVMGNRRPVGQRSSSRNERRAKKGRAMGAAASLSERGKTASRGRRRHFADSSGHVDGGPYGNDQDQGDQDEVFISDVPSAEAVEAPADDDHNISNTENTLVASLQKRIRTRAADLQRDLAYYRRVASDDNIKEPKKVDPPLSGTDEQDLDAEKHESVQPTKSETQPKDASVRAFAAFDQWLRSTTGKTAMQHGNANFIRRQAASFTRAAGMPMERMFPALEFVLREARKTEGARRDSNMKRRSEFDGETVAPNARVDVEAPVKNVTDADAQASQYDLGDYGHNAGDGVANPNLDTDSQIWAPAEGKSANRKADAVAAVRYAEAHIAAGLPCENKWNLIAQAQTLRHATVVDRTRLLEAVASSNVNRARTKKASAAVSRGTTNGGIPRGLTAPRRSASTQRTAANDSANDVGMWL